MPAKHKSARADGRGGWPLGKRRNPDTGDWARLRIELQSLLDDSWTYREISGSQLAATLGYSERSVRRWLKGEDRPPPEVQEMIRAWIAEKRAILKQRER